MDSLENYQDQNIDPNLQPKNKFLRYGVFTVIGLIILFFISLMVSPYLHPDHKVYKIGIITNVATSGDPYFNQTVYTLTFSDGDVVRLEASNSVPFPVGKPIEITYSKRGDQLLDINLVSAADLPSDSVPVHK